MGGNAHPSYPPPSRLTNDQHALVISTLRASFQTSGCAFQLLSPYCAPEKTSHGDVDLLLAIPSPPQTQSQDDEVVVDVPYSFPSLLASAGLYDARNGSYLYNLAACTYQIDITIIPEASLPLELFLRSYGDAGAIIGAYARHLGFKLSGPKGLQVRLQLPLSGTWIVYELSRGVREICERYLRLDYARWCQSFETEEALFEWLRSTVPYINMDGEKKEKPGAKAKSRDRPMLRRFRAWAHAQEGCVEQAGGLWQRLEDVGRAEEVRMWFERESGKERDARAFRETVNGEVVAGYLAQRYDVELMGSRLGAFMKEVRLRLPRERVPLQWEVLGVVDEVWCDGLVDCAGVRREDREGR